MGKNVWAFGAVIALLWVNIDASTQLGGEIEQTVITSSDNPYIVDQDVLIPDGKTFTIDEGCVLLFKPFTGLVVRGKLLIEGSPSNPVVLTSINDNHYNDKAEMLPNPFDWNGILIHQTADGAVIKNCVISFSVYGVKSQTARLDIESGTFRQNGQFSCTVNDKILPVVDNIQFSWKPPPSDSSVIASTDSTTKKKRDNANRTRRIIRYGGLGVGLVGAGVGTVFLVKDLQSRRIIQEYEEASKAGKDPPPGSTLKDAEKAYDTYPTQEAVAIVSYILGGLGLIGFTLTFIF